MGLRRYHQKRDFARTAEPRGREGRKRSSGSFVVQLHDASRRHYDFRLEMDGVLKSWACPKGPSFDPSQKRLAVHVEDHPLDYASFEGVIPEGEYGGGPVIVWDRGTWRPEGDPHAGYDKGHLVFALDGKKLHGAWQLVQMHRRDGDKNWLLIKKDDAFAKRGAAGEIVDQRPESVKTGRPIEALGGASAAVRHRGEAGASPPAATARTARARSRTATRVASAPRARSSAATRANGGRAGKTTATRAKPRTKSPRVDPAAVAGARRGAVRF